MRLSEEQRKVILYKLKGFEKPPAICPVCGNGNWSISDAVFELREFQGGNLVIGGQSGVFPVVPLVCDQCGNTLFLNAITLGVVSSPGEKGDDK